MAKKLTKKVKTLMSKLENIRNIGVVAHIDHGKTTFSDSLLAGAGMISEEMAGKQLAMDTVEQEQERGITIYSANTSMVHQYEGDDYLVNMIDTPGHVDFGGDVTRAMRAVDGVIVLVDAVEGIMPQTETVIRQAMKERAKPILFINKVDRLIKELKLAPEQMMKRFKKIITETNMLIQKYSESEFKNKWMVKVEDGSVAFGSAFKTWGISVPLMKKTNISFKDIIEMTENNKEKELAKKAPLHRVALDMVIKHLPNPKTAQTYRVPKIWPGKKDSEVGKSMISCNSGGPLAAVVTKVYPDPHAGYVATVRIFSGSIKNGESLRMSPANKTEKIQQVSLYKGQQRVQMDEVVAGNIVGIVGLKSAGSGETIFKPEEPIPPFEAITHIFEPVVTKAVEPKDPTQLAKLIEFLKKTGREDPTIKVKINEDTGEYLVSGLGELHIDAKVERPLNEAGIDVNVSPPVVIYNESVKKKTPEDVEGKSPNKHNRFYIRVEPLEPGVYKAMVNGDIRDQEVKKKDVELQEKLTKLGMESDQAKKVKMIENKCILFDMTRGVTAIQEVMEMLKESFESVVEEGPLAKEPCAGVKVMITDAKLHEDAIHRGPAQVIPAVRNAIKKAMLKSKAYMLEPKQIIRIDVPTEQMGGASKEINNRRGDVLNMKEERGLTIIRTKIPVAEMFGFNSALKSATGGHGFFSLIDIMYEPVPGNLQQETVDKIRERKGIKREEE